MAVVVMVQSGRLYESKIVVTRDGKYIYGFDIIFKEAGRLSFELGKQDNLMEKSNKNMRFLHQIA